MDQLVDLTQRILDPTDKLGSALRSLGRAATVAATTFGFKLDAVQVGVIQIVVEAALQVLVAAVPAPEKS